eukprot:scaffold32770_cov37-Attheya_sp.AAC.2
MDSPVGMGIGTLARYRYDTSATNSTYYTQRGSEEATDTTSCIYYIGPRAASHEQRDVDSDVDVHYWDVDGRWTFRPSLLGLHSLLSLGYIRCVRLGPRPLPVSAKGGNGVYRGALSLTLSFLRVP